MNEPVVAFDFSRMFFGQEPPLFLLEIALRTVIIYVYTLFLIRWIGSRSIGQLSLVEFLLVIALGSAVGDAMFYADVPLIHAMIVITVVVFLDKGLAFLVSRKATLEDTIEGKSVEVIRDGVIDWHRLLKMNVGHDELFEQLRRKEVEHVGQVRGAYFETNGLLSVFREEQDATRPGLPIVPPWDTQPPQEFKAGERPAKDGSFACVRCATVVECVGSELPKCPNCDGKIWHEASR